jgi:threonine dehydrogenase-like Zn-dependent dehydrogenase
MERLKGKTAIVIGASAAGNMGQAIARAFAQEGANVVVGGRNPERFKTFADEIGGEAYDCDITNKAQVDGIVEFTQQRFGKIDIGVNAAGWGLGTAPTHWHATRPWMSPLKTTTTLMAAHNEQVTRMPEGAVCLGGSDFCPIGSMQIGQHIWTTQFHPEMPRVFMQALLGYLTDKLDADTMARAHASLANAADVPLFGQWMVQFFDDCFERAQ